MTVQPAERVETDLSVIEALDFDPTQACGFDDCGKPAQFIGWYACCGESDYFCAPCKDKKTIHYLVSLRRKLHPTCPDCRGPHARDGSTLRFRPIKAT